MNDVKKKKLSRNAFSLLIRVVDELWYVAQGGREGERVGGTGKLQCMGP